MKLPDRLRQSIVFLGAGQFPEDPRAGFIGTGCLMRVLEDDEVVFYLVTAKHVLRNLNAIRNERGLHAIARLNDNMGNVYSTFLINTLWYQHPTDASVDAVACAFSPRLGGWGSVPREAFVHTNDIGGADQRFGIGDEVAIVGLFRYAFTPTDRAVVPIVRIGNLAMVPLDSALYTGDVRREVYLIEARSLGSLSGSPVFIHESGMQSFSYDEKTQVEGTRYSPGSWGFLGIARAHWDIEPDDINAVRPRTPEVRGSGVNIGVAMVVPSYKILEIIDGEEVRGKRIATAKKRKQDGDPKETLESELQMECFEQLGSALVQSKKPAELKPGSKNKARKKR